ncbi:uncharacterized protein Hap1MRO34_010003 [Clarias gariepinus]
MCDCFHLAFPNWHAPAAGAGRRLRGPEQEAEDDSVCDDPEVLERERPRPQGSSPIEEFPVEKQAEEDMSDPVHKSESNKKSRKAGFGSLFEKRTSDRMNETEDVQSGESEVIVKTVKEASVEGLVVTGGGKEGIFIKEVKLDSPASKELRVKEGDQILSATVYFDNVSYEDALQILERAQPYKMEILLRRKVEPTIPENAELLHPEEKDHGPPVMRSQRKMKKQQERISWPKFPSFGKGPKVQFNRSHSTSEAEEHRKLELSPSTSDNESPTKSPLKCPDGKDKKKKHKVELKMKMKGHRSKSVEEGILEEKVAEGHEEKFQDILQGLDGAEYEISTETENDDPFQMERHEAHLISLGNTLKTTDISVALANGGKRESSEMKVKVHEEDAPDIGAENQAESFKGLHTISAPPAHDSDVLPQTVVEKFDDVLSIKGTGKDSSEKNFLEFGHAELGMPNVDICVEASKKSPRIGDEKQRRSGFQNESYGIRTRGPMADIATAKSHFVRTENGLQFISPDFSELMQVGKTKDKLTDKEEIETSTSPTERLILADLDRTSTLKFKLPNIETSGFVPDKEIKISEVEKIRTHLPKRDDIEIPGMENKKIKPSLQTPEIKLIKTEKSMNITKEREIQYHQIDEEFNVEDVKVAVSKFPCFKLPEGDITGVLVQREITIMEQKSEKSTPRGSPRKISTTSTDSCTSILKSKVGEEKSPSTDTVDKDTAFKMPKVELPSIDEQTSIPVMKIDYTQLQITDYERFGGINFKLPKREDIEIPGMEAIKESKLQDTAIKTVSGADLDKAERPRTKKHSDKKGHDKKSKKPSQHENQSLIISTELQKRDPSKIYTEETRIHEKQTFKIPKIGDVENIDAPVQVINILQDTMGKGIDVNKDGQPVNVYGRAHDTEAGQGTKFKLPKFEISFPEVKPPRIICTSKKDDDSSLSEKESAEIPVVHSSKAELPDVKLDVDTDQTEINSEITKVKIKRPGFSFPRFGIATSEHTAQEADVNLTNVDMSLPEGSIETQSPDTKIAISVKEGKQKDATKFKIPSIKFPHFGAKVTKAVVETSYVEPDVKGAQISLPHTEIKLSAEPLSVDLKGPDADKEIKTSMKMRDQDFQIKEQGSKPKFSKFGISLPEVKGAKGDASSEKVTIGISVPTAELHPSDVELQDGTVEVKSDLSEVDSKDFKVKIKTPGFSFPRIGFDKSEIKAPEVDVSLPEGNLEIEKPTADVTVAIEDAELQGRSQFSSKFPSITFPKFGIKGPKASVEIPDVDVEVKGPEIGLPEAEIKLSAEPLSVDVKGPDADKQTKSVSVEIKDQDIQMKEQGTKFKLPKFGISLPEIKGPKIDVSSDKAEIDISVPKEKVEVHLPDVEVQGVTAEVKADLPEVDSKDFEVKMKTPGFSFPKIGFDKSEVKAPEVDVSLPEGNLEIEKPTTDVTVSIEDAEIKGRSKFGSPTKFKLPSINFPKFGIKGPKASVEIPDVDVEVKGPEIGLPEAEIKLSGEPLSVDVKGPDADKETKSVSMEIKDQDFQVKEQGTKFKLPKFGISLPEIKGPKIDVSSDKAEIDISVPKGKVEVHPPDVKGEGVTAEAKADLPEVDSKDFELKMKTPGFSFPKIGFDKSEVKPPEFGVSLPEGNLEIGKPTTDVTVSIEDAELKGRSKFGSPTKFKLPSINFPKFGVKGPKASVDIPDVDAEVKGPEISLPEAEIKLSADPLSVDVKGPDADKQTKSVSVEIKDQDIQIKEHGTKFKLPKFGISLPEIKGPKIDVGSDKAEIDISVPKGKVEVHLPDVEVQGVTAEVKADLPEVDSKDFEVKMKTPGFSFPKIGFDKSEVKAPEVDVSLPEGNLEIEKPTTDVTVSIEDAEIKGRSQFGSPTKFKLPSINFPKFGIKGPKASVEIPDVDVEVKGPEISLPEAEIKLSAEPLSVDVKGPDADKQTKSVSMEIKDQDIQMKEQGTKFKLPKFGISLPEIKGPKIDVSSDKAEIDISVPKEKVEVHLPDVEVQGVTAEVKADLPEVDSKDFEVKMKTPGFSFPKIGFDKSEVKAPEVDVSLPEGNLEIEKPTTDVTVSIEDAEIKGRSKFGSPTKFKLPSINFPKFGIKGPKASVEIPDVDVEVKGPEISLPEAEIKFSADPLSVDVKGPDADKQTKSVSVEIKDQDIQMKEQGTKFKLPKFGISLPEIKGPKIDVSSDKAEIDISVPKEKVEVHLPDVEVQGVTAEVKADLPEVDSKDFEVKMKTPGFSFPKIGFDKSEVKAPEVDVSLPEGNLEIEKPTTDVTVSIEDAEIKGRSKFGSPTKFKLPSINFPKFGIKGPKASVEIPDVDVEVKGPEIGLPEAEIKLSGEPLSVDVNWPDADKQTKSVSVEIKDQDIQMKEQGTKFKLPKFGISLPEIKGPKIDVSSDKAEIDISVPKEKVEVHLPDVEVQGITAEVKADLPEVDSKDFEVKMKTPGFSFPKIGFDKSEVKAPEVDVSLPEGNLEIEKPTTDVTVSIEDAEIKGRSKFGSPTKFKLPSINFPKFGVKGPKASVEIPDVDVEVKGPEISLPEAEIKLSADPLSVDVKGPDADKQTKSVSVEIKDQDIQMKEQGTKFKLPKFGISLPEIKGPKIDVSSDKAKIDISVPKEKVEVHLPDVEVQGVTAEVKADLPEVDSKDFEVKMKTPGFSFPKIGFDKSEVKAPEVDVSLPEGNLEIEKPTTDVTVSIEDAEIKGRSKFGSPTKFKLPSINFPKFGIKGPKASVEIPDVDVEVKGPEIGLPEAEIKLSGEPLLVDVKGPDADKQTKSISVEIKDQDIQMKEQGTKFKLPKFGISLPEIKGPKIDVSSDKAEIDISVPKEKVEVHLPDVEVQGVTAEVKADLPEVDSKDFEVKMKTPGFSFPKIRFDKSEVKAPEVDVSLPEGNLEIEKPTTDVTVSIEDAEIKGRSKFGSPTKFKLPSINFPKFGIKGPKASVEIPDVDVQVKGPEIGLPEAEIKLSGEPLSVDVKGPDADKQTKSVSVELKDQDIQMKEQGTKFKLPKFGISLPEIKGPKIDVSSDKAEIDISVPKEKVEVHLPDVEVQGVTAEVKADLPEVDSKDFEVKMKTPGFSFPKIGFDKSEVKAPEVDVSLPEGNLEIEKPTTDVTVSIEDAEIKGRSKFGSPTKFKLPSINFPKFGVKGPKASVEIPDVDVEVKGPEISLPEAEIKLSAEPLSVDVKGPDADKQTKSVSMEIKDQDIQMKEQGTKFKLPKFGISLPEIKGPKIDVSSDKAEIDISVPKEKVEVHLPDVEVQGVTAEVKADLPEVDSKDFEVKMKTPGFSFPKIGFDKSEVKAPEVDVSLPEGNLEIEKPTTDVTVSIEDAEIKGRSKFGSPTKFKLPSINFPKFGIKGPKASVEIPDVDVEVKGPEIGLPEAEIKLSGEPLSVDVKGPDADKETKSVSMELKDQDFQVKEQGTKFKLPKFGISLPEIKGPKIDVSSDKAEIDISVPKGKVEVHPPDVKGEGVTAEAKADLPEVDSKDLELKMKTPGFSFPKIGFDKSEVKPPEFGVSLPEGNLEIGKPTTDVTVSIEDAELKGRSKFGSPTKFKLPSINFPKFGVKGPKTSVDIPDVDVEVKGPEIGLPEAEIKLSAEPLSVDVKGPDADKQTKSVSVEIKDQDIQMKEQGTKFKLPKFGTSLPEIKGPKIDVGSDKAEIDISVPKGKVEVHLPDVEVQGVTAEVKADLPEVDSKDFEIKMKRPGLSFSKLSKSDSKVPASDLSLQVANISVPEKSKIEGPTTEITAEQNLLTKSSSPTKLKLSSINIPKFVKGLEVSLPDADISAKSVSEDIKEHAVTKDYHSGMAHPKGKDPEINIVSKSTSKAESGISSTKEVKIQSLNVKVKKVEVNNEEPITQMDSLMETYIAENDKAYVDILESKQKYTQRVKTSSKFILPTLGDVFSGFDVEFNVPAFDEIEGAKKIYSDIPLTKEECNISVKGQFSAESVSKHKDEGAQEKSKIDQNFLGGQKQTQPEISDWFRFPAFSSPTKTSKDNEGITFQLLRKAEPSPENDINENECKRSFTREFDEDNISPTLSFSSSDAFADISSALTTEQISLSLPSPTKVKVKYSEPIANAEGSDIHIVTSTARTELISIEPHQPEKVNIPFSSETSSSSVDTLKQISGHIVVANVQSVSKTEHATIITKVDTQDLNTLPAENVTDSMLSTEETTIQTERRTIYQKHSIKEVRK